MSLLPLESSSVPRLAAGCRLTKSGEEEMLLVPEGALRLRGPAGKLVAYCDGRRTFGQIVESLLADYNSEDRKAITQDAAGFLERLRQRGVVQF